MIRIAKTGCRLGKRIEHRLQIKGRTADDLEHVGGGGLLLQRFAQFVEQAGVLDGDDSLRGEVLDQLDLLIGERPNYLSVDAEETDHLVFLQHGHPENGSLTTELDCGNGLGNAFQVRLLDREIGNMDHLSRLKHAGYGTVSSSPQGCAPAFLDQRLRCVMCGSELKRLPIAQVHVAEVSLAETGSVRKYGLEHGLQIAGRA